MSFDCKTPADVAKVVKENDVRHIDLRFTDPRGKWQHLTQLPETMDDAAFNDGIFFDGSSIAGWKSINESDMALIPDPSTCVMDPFSAQPTMIMICDIRDPMTGELYSRDPRSTAKRAEAHLQNTGIGDTSYFGPEPEFFVFDDVRSQVSMNHTFYKIDHEEGPYNSGAEFSEGNTGHRPGIIGGYFPVPPVDSAHDLRSEMVTTLQEMGVTMEKHHHEVAPSQHELGIKFDTLVQSADNVQAYKYVVQMVSHIYGKTATFMPKPLFGDNGTGMHVHQSIWKGGKPLFAGDGYSGFSEMGLHYIGGILKHARAICAFTGPTTNSYKRLVPGFEAPVNLAYSSRNRSAAVRIPMYSQSPKAKRMEARFPDPSSNGYLAFAVMLMAGLDGIENKIDPGEPMDKDIYAMGREELANIPTLPGSLDEALCSLEADHEFMLKGDVFTQDLIDTWIDYKRENEVDQLRLRPHPYEFYMYYDV